MYISRHRVIHAKYNQINHGVSLWRTAQLGRQNSETPEPTDKECENFVHGYAISSVVKVT